MGKRKTPRLAFWGEYVLPDSENSEEVYRARLRLMETVKRVFPEFLKELSSAVLPSYSQLARDEKLAKEGYDFETELWSDNHWCSPYDVLTEDGGLKSALDKWALKFNATDKWIIVRALRTLNDWHVSPAKRESLTWNTLQGFSYTPPIVEDFEFSSQRWDVLDVTWPVYSESLRRRFEERLTEYETRVRTLAESRGLVRAQRKHSPKNFEWFALYQFAGLSSKEIADQSDVAVDDSTVLKGIKTAKKLISWGDLRKPDTRTNRKIG